MAQLEAVRTWNWSSFCGHGDDIQSWSGDDFGHCFEQVALLSPAHALFAIISTYHLARCRTNLRGSTLHVKWTWFLILRALAVILLCASPVFQIVMLITVEQKLPSIADGVITGVSAVSWLLHFLYVWNVRYLHLDSLRGPISILVAFFIVVGACAIHVHTVIVRHISRPPDYSVSEEYATYVNTGLCLVYVISVIPNRQRVYSTDLTFLINESDEESERLVGERIQSYNSLHATNQRGSVTAEKGVNCLSWITFQWVQALMTKGAKLSISNVDDLYLLPERLNTHKVDASFEKVLHKLKTADEKSKLVSHDHRTNVHNHMPDVHTREISEDDITSTDNLSYQNNFYHSPRIEQAEDQICDLMKTSRNQDTDLNRATKKRHAGLLKALITAFGLEYFLLGILKFSADSCGFAGPILLNYLVDFIETKSEQYYVGYLYAGGLFLSTLLSTIFSTQFDYNVQVVAFKIRCALITTIYRKSLTVNSVIQAKFTSGEIVNFMSTDTDRILNFCPSFHAFWSLPLQVAVSLFLLYQYKNCLVSGT